MNNFYIAVSKSNEVFLRGFSHLFSLNMRQQTGAVKRKEHFRYIWGFTMEYIASVFMNAVSDEREEEYSNWYNYVHLRDVLGIPGAAIACQRFEQSKYQPKNYDPTFKFYTLYEVRSKELFTKGHMDTKLTWKCLISSAMDFSNYKESYWDNIYGSTPYASYAEFTSDNTVLIVQIGEKEGISVEEVFTSEAICELGRMNGVYAANLYHISEHQMPKQTAAVEKYTHQLVIQLQDARDGIASWESFSEKYYDAAEADICVCNYDSVMPRLKACDRFATTQDRALSALYHTVTKLPGFGVIVPGVSNVTDVLTPAIKKSLDEVKG